jgi:ligand-binding sensor domain-containing protein
MSTRSIALGLFLGALSVHAQLPFHRAYTTRDGLSSDLVYSAIEDKEGYLWFCTDAGVSRFDGTEFMNLGPSDGLSDNEVLSVFEDSKGRIWFLTVNGRLSYWLNGTIHNGATDPILEEFRGQASWNNACEDSNGMIWFSSLSGAVLRLDLNGQRTCLFELGPSLSDVMLDECGSILILGNSALRTINGDEVEVLYELPSSWSTNRITTSPIRGNAPVGLNGSSIVRITRNGLEPLPLSVRIDPKKHRRIEQDRNGNLWLYQHGSGVEYVSRDAFILSQPPVIFHDWKVNSVHVSSNGDRWYCMASRGVILTSDGLEGVTEWHAPGTGPIPALISIAAMKDHHLIGSDLGSIFSYSNGKLIRQFEQVQESSLGRVMRIVQDGSGTVWFATDRGLFKATINRPGHLTKVNSHCSSVIHGIEPNAPAKDLLLTGNGELLSPGIGLWRSNGGGARIRV